LVIPLDRGLGLCRLDQFAQPADRDQQDVADRAVGLGALFAHRIEQLFGRVGEVLDALQPHESSPAFDGVQRTEAGLHRVLVLGVLGQP